MLSNSTHEVMIEIVFDSDKCLLSDAVCKSLTPEAKLMLRGVVLEVECMGCGFRLAARGSDVSTLIPPVINSLKLTSSLIETLETLDNTPSSEG